MRTALLPLFIILTWFGAAFAQSPAPDKTAQQHEKSGAAKADSKASKDVRRTAKKNDKDSARVSAKKADNAQNQVNAQAYKTTVPKP